MKEITLKFAIQPDVPNKNGYVYTKEAIENAFAKYNKNSGFKVGTISNRENRASKLSDIAFGIQNNVIKEGNFWSADIEVLDTPQGKVLEKLLDLDEYMITTNMIGTLDNDTKKIKECSIVGVNISKRKDIEYGENNE